jgi:hypothetical protein
MTSAPKAHSRFAASSAERWLNCSGSVELCDSLPPEEDSLASAEGTKAHDLLEQILKGNKGWSKGNYPKEMQAHVLGVAGEMNRHKRQLDDPIEYIEERVSLDFIDPEMFGTLDHGLAERWGDLVIADLKYGKGHAVKVEDNLQLTYYAVGLAHKHDWDFSRVVFRIYQPRGAGKAVKEHVITVDTLKGYVELFAKGVNRIKQGRTRLFEGSWCYFCKARKICPLKRDKFKEKVKSLF